MSDELSGCISDGNLYCNGIYIKICIWTKLYATYFEAIKYCNKFSRLKVFIFINGKTDKKKKNERKETSALKNEAVVPSQSTDRHL